MLKSSDALYVQPSENYEECIISNFFEEVNRGGLHVPTLNMAYLVDNAYIPKALLRAKCMRISGRY